MTLSDMAACACGLSEAHLTEYKGKQLHQEIVDDFRALELAAKNAGFDLEIASAYRSFERQSLIWNNKFSGKRPILNANNEPVDIANLSEIEIIQAIMLYSAMPGASRHHFGTDLDVFAPNLLKLGQTLQLEPWEYQFDGPFYTLNTWLDENLSKFGFYRPYEEFRGGVAEEPWHISHIACSKGLFEYQNIENIKQALKASNVLGHNILIENMPSLYERFVSNVCEL
ncbi:M15 family metallopeptidase [Pseudoalteromonas sp. BZB3]|uniref:M15 family metallopeptidase n=1 Tax=Pseudoalteromonas sp. BZB3 TaxID=3136670 RepID=UPI0032C4A74A